MGIIKTAMLMGGGIYAVNKIAKATSENRSQAPPNNNNQYDARGYAYPPQGYQGSQGAPPQQLQPQTSSRDLDDSKRSSSPPQQGYYLTNDDARAPLPQGYSMAQYNNAMSGQQQRYADEAQDGQQTPPPYANRQQMGFVFPREQGYENQDRAPSPLPALAGKAMDYAMSAAGGKSSKNGGGKGSDMLAGLFSR